MRLAVAALLLGTSLAHAEPPPAYRLVPDAALGIPLPSDHALLATAKADAGVAACVAKTPATASALVWLELGKAGAVTTARVHGSGATVLDRCLGAALAKVTATDKLPSAVIVVGHLDLLDAAKQDSNAFFPSPRISTVAVMVDPRGAAWQLGAKRTGYTANRAADISQAIDAQATAIAACAAKRGKRIAAADMLAWHDGTAIVRGSGDPAYDTCLTRALGAIKLPAPESALWLELELRQPGEPLAPKGTTHEQAVREGLHDAVRSKKTALDACLDKHPNAKLGTVTVALHAQKVSVKKVATGDASVDACVKKQLELVTVQAASASDAAELDVSYE